MKRPRIPKALKPDLSVPLKELDEIINVFGACHQYTYDGSPNRFIHTEGVSLTVPDMVLSMHEVFKRFVKGLPLPVSQTIYTEEDFSGIQQMSKFEIIDLQRRLERSTLELRQEILRHHNEAQKKIQEKDFADKVSQRANEVIAAREAKEKSSS